MINKRLHRFIIWIAVTVSVFIPLQIQAFPSQQQISEEIQNRLSESENRKKLLVKSRTIKSERLLGRFYQNREFKPAWIGSTGAHPLVKEMIRAIQQSRFEGLSPDFYHLNEISETVSILGDPRQQKDHLGSATNLDLLLTNAFLQLGRHLQWGKASPPPADAVQFSETADNLLLGALNDLLLSGRVFSILDSLTTHRHDYESLRKALGRYLRIKNKGGWPEIPEGEILKIGDHDSRINIIKIRLRLTGDLKEDAVSDNPLNELLPFFNTAVESAIRHFQNRHGLHDSGRLNRETLLALNQPVEKRLRQIQINMDLRRRLHLDLGHRHIKVNIPEMKLRAVVNRKTALEMRVIVGKPEYQTPVLTDTIPFLVFNPNWYIPPEFVEREILPAMKKNPDYLAVRGIRIFKKMSADSEEIPIETVDWQSLTREEVDFYFRQDPGLDNSLGAIKFVMPNPHHIYLHDTPSKNLFQRSFRALSSGCVRVERPVELATFVLQESQKWTKPKIRHLMNSGNQLKVDLSEPVPIHLLYWTVLVDRKGRLRFLPDIYNLEPALTAAFTTTD